MKFTDERDVHYEYYDCNYSKENLIIKIKTSLETIGFDEECGVEDDDFADPGGKDHSYKDGASTTGKELVGEVYGQPDHHRFITV